MDLRHYINLVETANFSFFHGSKRDIQLGTIIKGKRIQHYDSESKMVEKVLEHFKPLDCLSRNASVFMVDAPNIDLIEKAGGYADYIYSVEPLGKIEKNDVSWWGDIYSLSLHYSSIEELIPESKEIAINYWKGVSSKKPLWEYRTPAFKIVSLVGGYLGGTNA